jgi:hypothetical protein
MSGSSVFRMKDETPSHKGRLLMRAGRFNLCVQTETPPYQYVSVEGPIIATETADRERDVRPLAHRYLGIEMGDRYIKQIRNASAQTENVLIRMRPERWLTAEASIDRGDSVSIRRRRTAGVETYHRRSTVCPRASGRPKGSYDIRLIEPMAARSVYSESIVASSTSPADPTYGLSAMARHTDQESRRAGVLTTA